MYSHLSAILQIADFHCEVPENIHTPPPLPDGERFCFRPPTPLEWKFHGGLSYPQPPPPGISVIFQLGWVPSGKNICAKKVVALYVYAKDNFFCDEMRKNVFIYVNRVSNELKDVLS